MANRAVPRGEIVVDERGRTMLARVRSTDHTRYKVEEFPGGILLLVPLRTVEDAEVPEGMRETLSTPLTGKNAKSALEVEDWRLCSAWTSPSSIPTAPRRSPGSWPRR